MGAVGEFSCEPVSLSRAVHMFGGGLERIVGRKGVEKGGWMGHHLGNGSWLRHFMSDELE
jgi:hypothetical protein